MLTNKKIIIVGIVISILLLANVYQFYQFNQIVDEEETANHVSAERMLTRIQWLENHLGLFIETISDQQNHIGSEEIFEWNGILKNSMEVYYFSGEMLMTDFRYAGRPQFISPNYLEDNLDELKDIDYILKTLRESLYAVNSYILESNEGTIDLSNESMAELATVHELYSLLNEIIVIEDEMIINREDMEKLVEPLKRIGDTERANLIDEKYKNE